MENYSGIKFKILQKSHSFPFNNIELKKLAQNAHIHSLLGLTPIHAQGAAGNHSIRDNGDELIISKSCCVPSKIFSSDDFVKIHSYSPQKNQFSYSGINVPSSEASLHFEIYKKYKKINAIFHGHCELFNEFIEEFPMPITNTEHPYGSLELAESCINTIEKSGQFFIYLKNHGYVSAGESIEDASKKVLTHFKNILEKLTRFV